MLCDELSHKEYRNGHFFIFMYLSEINSEERASFVSKFEKIDTKEDFLSLLNAIKKVKYGDDRQFKEFKSNRFNFYTHHKNAERYYQRFEIAKKTGGTRVIYAPIKGLKTIQHCLNTLLQLVFSPQKNVHGFTEKRSILTNATTHQGMNFVYNIDLQDFFTSIDLHRVKKCLELPPFNLQSKNREELAYLIANLCCTPIPVKRKNEAGEWVEQTLPVLPQGAPTSPVLSNIVCQNLDRRLQGLAKRFGLKYTRYADDITFSSMQNVYAADGDFIKELHRIIADQNFHINEKKTRLQHYTQKQTVTGLTVNETANVPREYIKQIRQWLHVWEKQGYEKAEAFFKKSPQKNATNDAKTIKGIHLKNVLHGKLLFLRQIKGNDNATFKAYWKRYTQLVKAENKILKLAKQEEEKRLAKLVDVKSEIVKKEVKISAPHRPKAVMEFLNQFKDSNSGLKYLTHKWDTSNFMDYNTVIKKAKEDFDSTTKYNIPKNLFAITNQFAFTEKPAWSYKKGPQCKLSWACAAMKAWIEKNPDKDPNLDAYWEQEMIEPFKNLIELRRGTMKEEFEDRLKNIFKDSNSEWICKVDTNFKDTKIYTNTLTFWESIERIFNIIKKHSNGQQSITISLKKHSIEENGVTIPMRTILILDEEATLPNHEPEVENLIKGGDLSDIYKNFYGYCNWSIQGQFGSNGTTRYCKVNILDDRNNPSVIDVAANEIKGVLHQITFYV